MGAVEQATEGRNLPVMDTLLFPASKLRAMGTTLLKAAGVPVADAELVADSVVEANLRGVDSHGIQHLGIYVERVRRGLVELHPTFPTLKQTSSTVLIDGQNSLGQVAAMRAMQLAMSKAQSAGLALVGVRNTNHCGMLAYFALHAAARGMIGFASCNGPVNMAPWGSRDMLISNNPICFAIPAGQHQPIVLDMANSVVAKGKIYAAQSKGQRIPEGWALDKEGRPTTDPAAALAGGSLLPSGGPKGSGLVIVMDILAGLMTGSGFSTEVGSLHHELTRGMKVGLLMGAMDIESFMPLAVFRPLVDGYTKRIQNSAPAAGNQRVYAPGELEFKTRAQRSEEGIPLPSKVWQELNDTALKLGIEI
jgi:LDH2 family malate/lactate/ureidoglycolate dehydrogenase